MEYGHSNFTYAFQGTGDLLVDKNVGACGSFAVALDALFKYALIEGVGVEPITETSFITVPLNQMYFIEANPGAANVRDRGSTDFNRFRFGSHYVLKSEAAIYDPTTGLGPDDESAVAVAGFKKAEESEKEFFDQKKDNHRLKIVQEEPIKYEYWEET